MVSTTRSPRLALPVLCAVAAAVLLLVAGAWTRTEAATGGTQGQPAFAAPRRGSVVSAAGAQAARSSALRAEHGHGDREPLGKEWRMNVGHAIDVLRLDVSGFFKKEGYQPDFSIYGEEIEFVDAHMPTFHTHGINSYRSALATIKWSVHAAFSRASMEIVSLSPPVHNTVMMRWRLDLLPRDVFGPAKDFLETIMRGSQWSTVLPVTVEGYSHYEFDPWTGEIIKHTVDVKNPPTFLEDLVRRSSSQEVWSMTPGISLPGIAPRGFLSLEQPGKVRPPSVQAIAALPATPGVRARLAGATVPRPPRRARAPLGMRRAGSFFPQSCEDDFECNDGKANFPLQCCDIPIMGSFCCEPDDYSGGVMVRQRNQPVTVPIPVPVEEGPGLQR
mmetsp:Transcript_63124/g.162562  ORF Transcript_63124/g.162562 Transcript_63124/m.162562 type:complete len:388 (+) Transcript_63124:92-1255(+)